MMIDRSGQWVDGPEGRPENVAFRWMGTRLARSMQFIYRVTFDPASCRLGVVVPVMGKGGGGGGGGGGGKEDDPTNPRTANAYQYLVLVDVQDYTLVARPVSLAKQVWGGGDRAGGGGSGGGGGGGGRSGKKAKGGGKRRR